ncbi:hypothetical protein [Providencia sp. Me31A]|uniref:hypothetical protein n=1 Tax=Providencia sp. Me31A TaxID=3392637 RepID=UPI003D2749D2
MSNDNGTIQSIDGNVNIDINRLNNSALSRNNINTQIPKGILAGNDINISSGHIKNYNTDISAKKNINIKATNLNNYSAIIKSGEKLNIDTTSISNFTGLIKSGEDMNIATSLINNDSISSIESNNNLTINADRITNSGSILFKNGTADINSKNIINSYGFIQGETLNSISDVFNNNSGYVNTSNLANINATNIYNNNSESFKKVSTRFGLVNQSGGIESVNGSIKLSGSYLYNNSGKIVSSKTTRVPTGGDINLYLNGKVQNDAGIITSSKDININTITLSNIYGSINADNNANIKSSISINNAAGRINANNKNTVESLKIQSLKKGEITGGTVVIITDRYVK